MLEYQTLESEKHLNAKYAQELACQQGLAKRATRNQRIAVLGFVLLVTIGVVIGFGSQTIVSAIGNFVESKSWWGY